MIRTRSGEGYLRERDEEDSSGRQRWFGRFSVGAVSVGG